MVALNTSREKTGAAVMERHAVIADSGKLLWFEKLKHKQVEAAKAFVSGSDVFVQTLSGEERELCNSAQIPLAGTA